jgi:pseudouridine-5'-phosphate glycosidase
MLKYIEISPEVQNALDNNLPIVALESTIISHGMPYPKNVETALNCQNIIRENGAVPATIAIINGKLKVGLTDEEINYLGKKGRDVIKVSRRDIPYMVALKLDGATTVSATMLIASFANIKIFATGGIGGVHRGAELSFDISCDLEELGKTNVAVVCAGAKAILDLPKTLEYLETKGVLVVGYKTKKLPAFYSASSDLNVDICANTPEEIAEMINVKNELNLEGGILVTNPIPMEYEIPHEQIDKVIDKAVEEMNEKNIIGKESTPFLLAKICELTGGNSLESNIKLVYNNCNLAAKIAKGLR